MVPHDSVSVDLVGLDFADELRSLGVAMRVLTNRNGTIAAKVTDSGVNKYFEECSLPPRLALPKPGVWACGHALRVLNYGSSEAFVTDDSVSKLGGAPTLGLTIHLFADVIGLRAVLGRAGNQSRVAITPAWVGWRRHPQYEGRE